MRPQGRAPSPRKLPRMLKAKALFNNLSDRITQSLKNLRGQGRLSEADVDKAVREIRRALLDADVAVPVVRDFAAKIREQALNEDVNKALNPAQQVVKIVHKELIAILGGESAQLNFAKHPPTVIMLAGLQGAGKTTLAGKLAKWLKDEGHTPLLVAADLQRPNAVNQLEIVAQRAGVKVFAPEPGNGVGDPVAVALQSKEVAARDHHDVLIIDTAGRLGIDEEMMQQARDIRDAVSPDNILFVVDAMIGQDAARVAEAFRDGVGFSAVVLSKLDGDARGGAALSITGITQRPILFASTGEALKDFERFHPDRMANRILDMGDVLTLIEQAEKAIDKEQAQKVADKLAQGEEFNLNDFLSMLNQIKSMGSMKKMLGMMPGMGQYKQAIEQFDDSMINRVEAIVRSMTEFERANPKEINGQRRARIAKGSGTSVQEVNRLLEQFKQMQKVMGSFGQSMARGMPGAPMGFGKKSRGRMQSPKNKKKPKYGNPAKQAAAQRAQAQKANSSGAAFGAGSLDKMLPGGMPELNNLNANQLSQLPPELRKMLGK